MIWRNGTAAASPRPTCCSWSWAMCRAPISRRKSVPVSRLGQTINVFLTAYLMSQQTNMGQAGGLGLWELSGGGWANFGTYLDRVRKVTPADVQRAARTYMKGFRFVLLGDTTKVNRGFVTSF